MEYSSTHDPANEAAFASTSEPGPSMPPSVVGPLPSPSDHAQGQAAKSGGEDAAPVLISIPKPTSPPKERTVINHATGKKYVYPALTVPNPAIALPPLTTTDVQLGLLERPHYIPEDLDQRVDRASVWMKTVPTTDEVIFFIPGSCSECLRLQQHCDRTAPVCARCQRRGATCRPQPFKHLRPAAPLPIEEKERRLTAAEKGKGRQVPNGEGESDDDAVAEEGGRGKRVKKKRRLSASDEVDPNHLNFDGTGLRKARARPSKAVTQLPSSSAGYLRPEDVIPTEEDVKYKSLCDSHMAPALQHPRGIPPFWANRRRALQSALPSFRDHIKTDGALVDIAPSGVARGVILEGAPHETTEAHFFGTGERAGTILTNIGKSRRRRVANVMSANPPPGDVKTEPLSLADDFQLTLQEGSSNGSNGLNGHLAVNGTNGNGGPAPEPQLEERAVEALLMAHRAGTPVAVAVTPSYAHTPFRVGKDILGLGWFWVLDAWTELAQKQPAIRESEEDVVWRFRFEWCGGQQPEPWWSSTHEADRAEADFGDGLSSEAANPIRKASTASTTLRGAAIEETHGTTRCSVCDRVSADVYDRAVCLNEACMAMNKPADGPPRTPTTSLQRGRVLITPESLGMTFSRPAHTHATADVARNDAQRNLWSAWVCAKCHMANERRDWFGLLCEWCSHIDYPKRKIYAPEALRPPSRPVYTGQRQDAGFASWVGAVGESSALFPDEVKVAKWTPSALGPGSEVALVMAHEGVNLVANMVLKGLQIQGPDEVFLRRHALPAYSSRPAELALCPFYTLLLGPNSVPFISHLPTGTAVGWTEAPKVALDAMDVVNERAGRVHPGEPEFNSLLLAAFPPIQPATVHPSIPIPANTTAALLVLGSDATLKLRSGGLKCPRAGELCAQHGDVFLVRSGAAGAELEVRTDGFGFVGLARRAYSKDDGPPTPVEVPPWPLHQWYIGVWPLDTTAPLRPHPSLCRASSEEKEVIVKGERDDGRKEGEEEEETLDAHAILAEPRFRGQEVAAVRPPPTLLSAPSHPPLMKVGDRRRKRVSVAGEDSEDEGTPGPSRRGRGRGKATSTSSRGATGSRGKGRAKGATTRGKGRGRGSGTPKGRGGKSNSASTAASPLEAEEDEEQVGGYDGEGEQSFAVDEYVVREVDGDMMD